MARMAVRLPVLILWEDDVLKHLKGTDRNENARIFKYVYLSVSIPPYE